MSDTSATQKTVLTLEAVVYPVCKCGRPYPEHATGVESFACVRYSPVRPIEDYGVIARGER